MKKSTPSLDELVDRLATQIQARYKGSNIKQSGKEFLKSKWIGQEARLYEKVKKMENQQVQFENLQKNVSIKEFTYCTGVDFLGFPTYTTHQVSFFRNESAFEIKQFDHKENYNLRIVTSWS